MRMWRGAESAISFSWVITIEGHAALFLNADEHFHDAGGVHAVQIAGGLIGQQDGGLVGQSTGNGYALALSGGKLVGILVKAVFKAHLAQQRLGALGAVAWRRCSRPSMGTCTFSRALQRGQQIKGLEDETHLVSAVVVEIDCGSERLVLKETWPAVGVSRPPSRCSRVDLPLPLGPLMATYSPAAMERSTPRRASMRPSS